MANKIELYREVLEIEPNSKVFFPLARELAEEGHVDAAVAALQKGIAFHPDHLEAKFLLIDILTRQGREGEAESVFTDVGALLARYPSVWLLWSKAAAARSRDPSLAMLFLGHYFQNGSLTWSEVMERGLRSLTQAASESRPEAEAPCAPVPSEAPEVAARPEPAVPSASVPSAQASVVRESASERETESLHAATEPVSGVPPLRGAREVMELADLLEAPDSAAPAKSPVRTGKARETPVRTRTMASLLASQGDIDGALEIYDALIESATGPERAALEAEAAALAPAPAAVTGEAARPSSAPEVDDAAPAAVTPEDAPPQRGAAKLINLLEALAGRLEARSEA